MTDKPTRRHQLADQLDRLHARTNATHGSRAAWLAIADQVLAIEHAAHGRGTKGEPK